VRRRLVPLFATVALLLVAGACGSSPEVEAGAPLAPVAPSTQSVPETTTSAPAPPAFPLTGLPMADPAAAAHPAIVVKMDNSPDARPQSGINEADIVYELLVEGITRYALVFHSTPGEPVGPVRSARSSDMELVANLSRPLVGWSGGNPGVTGELRGAADAGTLVDAGVDTVPGEYWRERGRQAPHNLYLATGGLLAAATPEGAGAPAPIFAYRAPGEPSPTGTPVPGITVDFGQGVRADYVWDAERGGWDRFQIDGRHRRPNAATVDQRGVQVAPANVVVLFLDYQPSPVDARSPMAISTGEGDAIVLTDGKIVHGRWTRPTGDASWGLVDEAGAPIALTPGRTWVALPEIGSAATPMDPGIAEGFLAER
jgi:hypothetical protein